MRVTSVPLALSRMVVAAMKPEVRSAPFGAWESPISAAQLAQSAVDLADVRVADGKVYWVERRPAEAGRYVVVTPKKAGGIDELTPAGFNGRTRVHEYGGSAYAVSGGDVYFSNFADQRLYRYTPGGALTALTPEGYRYADCVVDAERARIFCVREDHTGPGEPANAIVVLSVHGGDKGRVLFGQSDFVAYPRVSPDGSRLTWIAWNHPDMPWDATTLYVADLEGNNLANVRKAAGGGNEAVIEPNWDLDGTLYFTSDRSDWWNLYRWRDGKVEAVTAMQAELASPLWRLGQANYALTGDGRAIIRYSVRAEDALGVLDLRSKQLRPLDLPFTSLTSVQLVDTNTAVAIAASGSAELQVIQIDLRTGEHHVLRAPSTLALDATLIAAPEPIEFPTAGGARAHAFFYPPTNPRFKAPANERPPLLVKVHGGPTSHTKPVLDIAVQYWTSRGFAVVDVNHRGSSGYGRRYRQLLNGAWGIADVEDVVAVVRYLVDTGRVDPRRVAIRGGSAGGFTTLAALAFTDTFRAGANYYGVSDLELLARDTHKFESRYLDRLVAPLPQGEAVYEARSPIRHVERFNEPLITFQGVEDKVVPPEQSRLIVDALRKKGVPVAYVEFEGEQHGFRKADSVMRAAEAELYFYGQVFGFQPAGPPGPVRIENLREL